MKILTKVLISLLIALSITVVSSPAFAEADAGRVTYKPAEAIDIVAAKIQEAIDSLTTGGDAEAVTKLAKTALDGSKEINANDKVDAKRSKANDALKRAIKQLKEGDRQGAETELRDAHTKFLDLKSLI
ncbi:MAG: hypothetical protein NTW85_14590 [Methylococcales bacterium]|nr:hypothetical protein [Methylococcales bacterium]